LFWEYNILYYKQYCDLCLQYCVRIVNFCFQANDIVLLLFVLFAILFCYCLYCLWYCLRKNYVVCIVYNIVGFCVLIQYGFVLFIHHRYLLSRFLLFSIANIVLCIVLIVTLKWQQYYTTIFTINWTMEGGSNFFPKQWINMVDILSKMVKKILLPCHTFSQYPIMKFFPKNNKLPIFLIVCIVIIVLLVFVLCSLYSIVCYFFLLFRILFTILFRTNNIVYNIVPVKQ
jgi:hypothetical protein